MTPAYPRAEHQVRFTPCTITSNPTRWDGHKLHSGFSLTARLVVIPDSASLTDALFAGARQGVKKRA